MVDPGVVEGNTSLWLSRGGRPTVRAGHVPTHVVSIVFASDIEEWRRGWHHETPTREAVVSVGDPTRGATTAGTTQLVPRQDLAYSVLGTPIDIDRILETVSQYFSGATGTNPTVIVDDLVPVLDEFGPPTLRHFVESLSTAARDVGGNSVFGCSVTPALVRAVDELTPVLDEVGGVETDAIEAVNRLRREDPTTFGYTRRYWPEARRGIEACTRNYPQSKQIHAALDDPETTPRTLGATLSGLVDLGVLGTWGDTVGSTRYDLTAYDPIEGAYVGFALEESGSKVSFRRVQDR
ncbi:DUF7504 family protein [Halorubrum sp. DTA98]|uniref:DUF7504 family protein n=1 Tax=Halorubrum sp. DTA98 TaxID=3402163 RepID=UPI003AAAD23B